MHEYPVTQKIIQIAEKTARDHNAIKIIKIKLAVGELSGFIGESIQMYFDILSKNSIAEGAEIVIRSIRQKLKCESCGHYFTRRKYSFICPKCGGSGLPSETGKEFYIENIEIIN